MAMLVPVEELDQGARAPVEIEVPASTAWPIVLAFGFTLLFAGLLTSVSVSTLGLVLSVAGCVGWFREVFPHEHEQTVPVVFVKTYPISAGVKGGVAGAVAMAVMACAFGAFKAGSIWYPINLLAATVYAQSLKLGPAQLNSFHSGSFAIALVLHGVGSIFVGLLYGAMLPMIPRRPIVLGGLIAPVLWSGLLYSTIELLNPFLASHINWFWFIASQIGFGVVAGIVVLRQRPVSTHENLPFVLRAGIEAPGTVSQRKSEEKRP